MSPIHVRFPAQLVQDLGVAPIQDPRLEAMTAHLIGELRERSATVFSVSNKAGDNTEDPARTYAIPKRKSTALRAQSLLTR